MTKPRSNQAELPAIDVTVRSGNRRLETTLRGMQMGLLANTIDVDAALSLFAERVDVWQVMGDSYAASGVTELANMLARLDYLEGAAQLHGAVNKAVDPDTAATLSPFIVTIRDTMGRHAFNAAYEAGARLGPQAAGQLAQQLIAQARAEHVDNNT